MKSSKISSLTKIYMSVELLPYSWSFLLFWILIAFITVVSVRLAFEINSLLVLQRLITPPPPKELMLRVIVKPAFAIICGILTLAIFASTVYNGFSCIRSDGDRVDLVYLWPLKGPNFGLGDKVTFRLHSGRYGASWLEVRTAIFTAKSVVFNRRELTRIRKEMEDMGFHLD